MKKVNIRKSFSDNTQQQSIVNVTFLRKNNITPIFMVCRVIFLIFFPFLFFLPIFFDITAAEHNTNLHVLLRTSIRYLDSIVNINDEYGNGEEKGEKVDKIHNDDLSGDWDPEECRRKFTGRVLRSLEIVTDIEREWFDSMATKSPPSATNHSPAFGEEER